MRKFLSFFVIAALLLMPVSSFAAAKASDVGGVPIYWSSYGASAATKADVTIALPAGFVPDLCVQVNDTTATNANIAIYTYPLANDAALLITGSTGVITAITTALDFTTTAGSVIIDTDLQVNSGDYVIHCWRYQQ